MGKLVRIGVWEDLSFVGVVLFGRGISDHIGTPYGLAVTECCELVRIALHNHIYPVSRIVSIAIKMLRKQSPGLRLIISFADTSRHIGIIYQAMNWLYIGNVNPKTRFLEHGKVLHDRTAIRKWGSTDSIPDTLIKIKTGIKYRYAYPLDEEIRKRIAPLSRSYPKMSCATSIEGDVSSDPTGRGGFNATVALQDECVEGIAHA